MDKDIEQRSPLATSMPYPPDVGGGFRVPPSEPGRQAPYPLTNQPVGMPQPLGPGATTSSSLPPPPPYSARDRTTNVPNIQYPTPPRVQPVTTTVIVTNRPTILFGASPQTTTCPYCRVTTITTIKNEYGDGNNGCMGILLCLLGCWICACLMCCMGSYRHINHYCSNCRAFLGTCQLAN